MIQSDNFQPFLGVVESVDDPEQIGRVQVRLFGLHTRNKGQLPTEGLPWFSTIVSNSSGLSGVGHSPTEYIPGSTVFGYLIGQDGQRGIVLGSITGRPSVGPDPEKGFGDPSGTYPKYGLNESDVNRLARGSTEHWLFQSRTQESEGSWEEPGYGNNATYPMNHVYETPGGHVVEYDDTPDNERIHEYHKSGTYREIYSDGTRSTKIIGTDYEIIVQDKNVYVKGVCNLTVDSDCNTKIKGDWNVAVDGNVKMDIGGNQETNIGGSSSTESGGDMSFNAPRIDLNE